jgi:hypothetical protein
MNRRRVAIAQYEATVVLIMISLSLASIVYAGLRRESTLKSVSLFVNSETLIGGSPVIDRIVANSSSSTVLSSFSLDAASSTDGVLAFDGSGYSTSIEFCARGATTFFSVFTSQPGLVQITTDGRPWVSGSSGESIHVSPGWHEVMIAGGTSCSITLPGGKILGGPWSPGSAYVSSIPVDGNLNGTSFSFYVPTEGNLHHLLITSSGGFDIVAM